MSQARVLDFLLALRASPSMLARYDGRNLAQLLLHARYDGYQFSADDLADVAGRLEASVILDKDHDPFDATSRLWRRMWGRRHLGYLVEHVVARHSETELRALFPADEPAGQTGATA